MAQRCGADAKFHYRSRLAGTVSAANWFVKPGANGHRAARSSVLSDCAPEIERNLGQTVCATSAKKPRTPAFRAPQSGLGAVRA